MEEQVKEGGRASFEHKMTKRTLRRPFRVQTKSALCETERNAAGFDAFFLVGVKMTLQERKRQRSAIG